MKKYIGTKQIEAEPMTLGEACSKGLVKSEIEKNESYKLGYHTRTEYGYESWSPKKLFEESYREVKEETPICFGDAIDVLKQGGVIRRKGWNGKGLMVFKTSIASPKQIGVSSLTSRYDSSNSFLGDQLS